MTQRYYHKVPYTSNRDGVEDRRIRPSSSPPHSRTPSLPLVLVVCRVGNVPLFSDRSLILVLRTLCLVPPSTPMKNKDSSYINTFHQYKPLYKTYSPIRDLHRKRNTGCRRENNLSRLLDSEEG